MRRIPLWSLAVLTVLIVGIAYFGIAGLPESTIISGYDGVTAQISGMSYDESKTPAGVSEANDGTSAQIDPIQYWPLGSLAPIDPTGVMLEVDGMIDVHNTIPLDTIPQTIDNGDGTDTIKKWVVQEVNCSMGATVSTYGIGLDLNAISLVFTVTLEENGFSVFTDANQTYACILEVYTRSATQVSSVLMDVVPKSGGYNFPMTSLDSSPLPDWFLDSGYNVGNLNRLSKVSFDIKVNKAQPSSFAYGWRTDNTAIFDIGVSVFLVGYWERTVNHGWEPPDVPPGMFDWLFSLGAAIVSGLQSIGLSTIWPIAIVAVVVLVLYLCIRMRR